MMVAVYVFCLYVEVFTEFTNFSLKFIEHPITSVLTLYLVDCLCFI